MDNIIKRQNILVLLLMISSILLITTTAMANGDNTYIKINHIPVYQAVPDEPVTIEINVEGQPDFQDIQLYYRQFGESGFKDKLMREIGNLRYAAEIPSDEFVSEGVEYFIVATLKNGGKITYPEIEPYDNPIEISVETSQYVKKEIITTILSPEEGEEIAPADFMIAVSLYQEGAEIDPKTIRLSIDKQDVTSQAEVTPDLVTYIPRRSLSKGRHTAELKVGKLSVAKWQFRIGGRSEFGGQQAVRLNGNAFGDIRQEKIGATDTTLNFTKGGFKATGNAGFVDFGGQVYATAEEDEFSQPRNRLSGFVDLSWLRLNFGDVNPRVSDLLLFGKRIRGFEAQLKLGFINFQYIDGSIARAVEGDWDINFDKYNNTTSDLSHVDSLDLETDGEPDNFVVEGDSIRLRDGIITKRPATFRRNLKSARLSFGSGKSAQWGLSFVKAKDDTASVNFLQEDNSGGDFLLNPGNRPTPKDNLVLGSDLKLAFNDGKFLLRGNLGYSFVNNNIYRAEPLDSLAEGASDNLPGGIKEETINDIITIGADLSPLPGKIITEDDGSTSFEPEIPTTNLAYNVQLKLKARINELDVRFRSHGQVYSSFGNTGVRTDIEGLIVRDRIRLFNNKLFLSLNYENSHDNLRNQKDATTTFTTQGATLNIFPGGNLPNLTINFKQNGRDNGVSIDSSGSVDNTTQSLSFSTGFNVNISEFRNTIGLNFSTNDKIDNADTSGIGDAQTFSGGISFKAEFSNVLSTTVNLQQTNNKAFNEINDIDISNLGIRVEYKLFKNKLMAYGGFQRTGLSGFKPAFNEEYRDDQTLPLFIPETFDLSNVTITTGGIFKLGIHTIRGEFFVRSYGGADSGGVANDVKFQAKYEFRF